MSQEKTYINQWVGVAWATRPPAYEYTQYCQKMCIFKAYDNKEKQPKMHIFAVSN